MALTSAQLRFLFATGVLRHDTNGHVKVNKKRVAVGTAAVGATTGAAVVGYPAARNTVALYKSDQWARRQPNQRTFAHYLAKDPVPPLPGPADPLKMRVAGEGLWHGYKFKNLEMVDPNGEVEAGVHLLIRPDGTAILGESQARRIWSKHGIGLPNARRIVRQIQEQFPEVKVIQGMRGTGSRPREMARALQSRKPLRILRAFFNRLSRIDLTKKVAKQLV